MHNLNKKRENKAPKKMGLYSLIKNYADKHNLLPQNSKILLGLSGGPDSVFLFYYLLEKHINKEITLITAHLDHEWRKNSHIDAQFCKELAKKNNITHINKKLSDISIAKKYNGSKEAYAREARRQFFSDITKKGAIDAIALAHHADDQQETFFIRLIRGTSLSGLCAMMPKKDTYIRPLLETSKKDILAWLHENNIPYLVDETNASAAYLRNRIRNNVIPALKDTDSRINQTIPRTIEKLQQAEKYLQKHTQELLVTLLDEYNQLDLKKLLVLDQFMQQRIVQQWLIQENVYFIPTESFYTEVFKFLRSERGGSHTFYHSWTIVKRQQKASIKNHLL